MCVCLARVVRVIPVVECADALCVRSISAWHLCRARWRGRLLCLRDAGDVCVASRPERAQ